MGITRLSLDRIDRHVKEKGKMLILGCQNLYNSENYYDVAHPYFENLGFSVRSWDITGCQGSEIVDLREDLELRAEYDYITDFGTCEHINGSLYQPYKNIHEGTVIGGIIIHENPRFGHWDGHGQHYFTQKFYEQLCSDCDYELLEVGEEPAMGNSETGMNIYSVIRKVGDKFCTEEQFGSYDLRKS